MNISGGELLEDKNALAASTAAAVDAKGSTQGGEYVPPSLRDGATKGAGSSLNNKNRDDCLAIRVSNLSEYTQDADLEDMVKQFGPINKLFLAKDKTTGLCKGFAYIHFKMHSDAANALAALHRRTYDHLILDVQWSKPPQSSS